MEECSGLRLDAAMVEEIRRISLEHLSCVKIDREAKDAYVLVLVVVVHEAP